MRARFYRLNPQGYHNMVRDIADRLLLDNQADEVAILQTVKAKLTAEECQLVATALDQMAQRSRHIATQLCVVSKEPAKVKTLKLRASLLVGGICLASVVIGFKRAPALNGILYSFAHFA